MMSRGQIDPFPPSPELTMQKSKEREGKGREGDGSSFKFVVD